jgi:hypothetical protein
MKNYLIRPLSIAVLSLAAFLAGCSGFDGARLPDVPTQASIGTIQGNVFGGHAPIVGAHVFVLQTATSGYGATASSLLLASSTGTSTTYPVTLDNSGGVTNGLYYVTSDLNGAYNISGDYTCSAGSAVYLYASGGSPANNAALNITSIAVAGPSSGTYTYTLSAANSFTAGQTVQFSTTSLGGKWSTLNGTSQIVVGSPSSGSFQISTTTAPSSSSTNTQTGTAVELGTINPAIVNMAMLGVCPSSAPFNLAGTIAYVYMNEISTVAMAYGFAGFATDSLHIGASATNAVGIANAANNTANLYNIQAGGASIANATTVAGNGTVPQGLLDTLGNVLAACVDSANTATSASSACSSLFADATKNGVSTGTKPIDTASAAINIAHYPSVNVTPIYNLAVKTSPFSPGISPAPADFTVAFVYNKIATPGGIALDSAGNAYVPTNATSGYVTKLSPAGAVLNTSATAGSGFDSIAVDPSGNLWAVANGSATVYEFTSTLGPVTGSPFGSGNLNAPAFVSIDSSGYIYVTDGGNSNQIIQKFNSNGTLNTSLSNGCLTRLTYATLDAAGYLWATIPGSNAICRVSSSNGNQGFQGGVQVGTNVGIDGFGNGWVGQGSQTNLYKFGSGGGSNTYGVINNNAVGGLNNPSWVAIDGGNNVWLTNGSGNSQSASSYGLAEFNNAGATLSPAGYQAGGPLNGASFIAIDGSGDVWVPVKTSSTVVEVIGAATPTVQPLSALSFGVEP